MAENIVIKQSYFANIQTAINSLNTFFSSGFKTKNFPVLDGDFQLDPMVERIISRLDAVDPTWLEDEQRLNSIIAAINENIRGIDPVDGVYATIVNSNNEMMINSIDAYIGFKMLQVIADNFQEFSKFINGIYTFEIFTNPAAYTDVLDIFGQFIPLDEIPELDLEEKIFDEGFYVDGVFKNEQIALPETMTLEEETERIINRTALQGVEVFVDDSVQEAAEINFFENSKPKHMKYSEKTKKWMVSQQFEKTVNDLVAGLRKCDSTDDLNKFFSSDFWNKSLDISETVMPYILAKVFSNTKKFPFDTVSAETEKYWDSYKSILKQNNGAKRFENYDLYSTFKTDKEGTIKFVEDFLKLKLVNDPDASIANNTLLTLFNIFDSRIYLDIVYNYAPESVKSSKTEDAFVKEIRGRINKNSRTNKTYTDDKNDKVASTEDKVDDSKTVSEYVSNELSKFGDMSISDMMYCEQFSAVVEQEIETVGDKMFNAGISPLLVEEYIGESFNDINSQLGDFVQEANVVKRRETLQSAVSCLMAEMEKIVDLDKKHRWNNNTFVHSYKTTAGLMLSIIPNVTGSTKAHTDIKQVYHWTKKAVKGKSGNFTNEQIRALSRLNDLVGDLWGTVKIFWVNPINWTKHANIFNNDKIQKRVKEVAVIARRIVDMKEELEFLQDDDFVVEAWYDGSPDYVFQEATTETNRARLKTAIGLLMRDMDKIADLTKKNQWTNNACISTFKGETKGNVKQAIKYANRATGGSCGKFQDAEKSTLKDLIQKLEELMRSVNSINMNPFVGKNIKESSNARKVGTLAAEIAGMKSSLDFINSDAVKDSDGEAVAEEKSVQESFEYDFDGFSIIMEQDPDNNGKLPDYIQNRFKMSDKVGATVTPAGIPDGVPQNPIPEITDSIGAKLDAGGDNLGDMLGSGFENNPNKESVEGKIVVNVTNNYNNSFNRDSNNTTTNTTTNDDHSTGKTTNTTNTNSNNKSNSDNDNSHHNQTDSSSNKSIKKSNSTKKNSKTDNSDHSKSTQTKGSNNNNNSNASVDTKDSPTFKDGEQKLSSGKTVQEMFMFLESKEPQSSGNTATPPKESTLTKAMDRDKDLLVAQQKAKKGTQTVVNTGKAVMKPVTRTKQWLTKVVNSLIKRDEDKVKAALIENRSYRSAVFKASRLAIKLGLVSVAFSIQPYLGLTIAGIEGLRLADRSRLKKEVQREMEAELEVIDEKIKDLESINTVEARKEKYEYMRMKKKVEQQLIDSPKRKTPSSYWDSY